MNLNCSAKQADVFINFEQVNCNCTYLFTYLLILLGKAQMDFNKFDIVICITKCNINLLIVI